MWFSINTLLASLLLLFLLSIDNNNDRERDADNNNKDGDVRRRKSSPTVDAASRELQELPLSMMDAVQPRFTRVEKGPASRVIGSLSMAEGSPWCGEDWPTYWLVGHQKPEQPWCQHPNGYWVNKSAVVHLDIQDGIDNIDRHDCEHMDVNDDGREDIICVVGANRGTGLGYNELYLTQRNGTVKKVQDYHGLQRYPSMRTRLTAKLKDATGAHLLFIATNGEYRDDGLTNAHRMFRNYATEPPYFEEIRGNWTRHFGVACAVTADVNQDGLDDLILCQHNGLALFYVQHPNGTFDEIRPPRTDYIHPWRNVRVAKDLTLSNNKERLDLVVVEGWGEGPSHLRIYRGIPEAPYFDFFLPIYSKELPFPSPDLEILDVNMDGHKDIYVAQANELSGYCALEGFQIQTFWGAIARSGGGDSFPPDDWVPPLNEAADILLMGGRVSEDDDDDTGQASFWQHKMNHRARGCSGLVERFGSKQALILSSGRFGHFGYNYLLEWGVAKEDPET